MKLELVSYTRCPFVHRAAIVLHEKNLAFDIRYIDLKNKPDWFLKISPRGRVPVLVADGKPLFESNAISEFIDETHPPRMLPDDPFERARHRAWIEVCNDLLDTFGDVARAEDQPAYVASRKKMDAVLDRFEETLVGPFFAGEKFSILDSAAAPALHRMHLTNELPSQPKTRAWCERVATRASVVNGVRGDFRDDYFGRLRERGSYLLAR